MKINEYGDRGDPTIILMAPLLVLGSDLYRAMSPFFRGPYHIIAPDQGGHGKAGPYISAEEEYAQLKSYLTEYGISQIHLAYGASLGTTVAGRLFSDPDFEVGCGWLDGAVLQKKGGLVEKYMNSMFKSQKKGLESHPGKIPASMVKSYGIVFARQMTGNLKRLSQKEAEAISHAMSHFDLPPLTGRAQKKMHLDYGEKDASLKYSKKELAASLPGAELVIRKGCIHCGYMAAHMKEYVNQMEQFMIDLNE